MRYSATLLLGLLLAAGALPGQVSPPVGQRGKAGRGLTPAAAFALSEIETVNLVNGNLLLRLPVVSLPPGRGGSSFTLHLLYNSQIYDVQKAIETPHPDMDATAQYLVYRTLIASSEGGWRWGFQYGLEYEFKLEGEPRTCTNHILEKFQHKMRVNFPDGSSHLLRLVNSGDTVGDDAGDGYYAYEPDGSKDDCYSGSASAISGDVRYITTDGSFAHVVIHDNSSNPPWYERAWTIHLRDGARVHGVNDRTTSIVDRNGNTLDVEKGHCDNPATTTVEQGMNGASCTILRDDLGRKIQIVEPPGGTHYVVAKGHGGTKLQWKIQRSTIDMTQASFTRPEDYDGALPTTVGREIPTISWLELPTTPNRQRYTFSYHDKSSGYGELKKMTFPAREADEGGNGSVTYSYAYASGGTKKTEDLTLLENPVVSKQLSYTEPITDDPLTENWSYAISNTTGISSVTAPDGGVTTSYFYQSRLPNLLGTNAWKAGLTWKVAQPNGDTVERYWAKNQAYNSPAIHASDAGNPYVAAEYRTLGTKTAATKRTVDKNGNPLSLAEYDYDVTIPRSGGAGTAPSGSPSGTPLRTTKHSYTRTTPAASSTVTNNANGYWQAPTSSSPRLLSLVNRTEVRQGGSSGTVKTESDFVYDSAGNLTSAAHGLSADEATTRHSYDSHGNLTQTTYPESNITKFTYGTISGCPETGSDLYPTRVVEAFGSSVARTTTFAYNCDSGRVTTQRDVDNSLTQTFGYDTLGRPTSAVEAALRQLRTSYQDDQRTVFMERDQLTRRDYKLATAVKYDALGRLARERSNTTAKISKTGTGGIRVERGYRYSGANRYELVSTPYVDRGAGWTRTKYDRNGRVVEVKVFAGKPAPWGSNTTSLGTTTTRYSANTTTVTDPDSVTRTHTYDGLGRLTRVRENGISATTCYSYDVLDNLTSVRQGATESGSSCSGGQLRTFAYDSLSRLKTAVNPESGTTRYTYDDNGNLLTMTDARGGRVDHGPYDDLDRNTRTRYSGGGSDFSSTPAVTYSYDASGAAGCKNQHRLTAVSSSVSTTRYSCYDGLGRVTTSSQQTGGATYSFSYAYNPDDTLESVTYPSTRKLAYQYDAAGRLTAVGENTVGASDYASAIRYKPHGGINTLTLGNGLYESWTYNQRLQTTQIKLGATSSGSDKLKLEFNYGASTNNGNLLSQIITRPGLSALTQTYTYDQVNRLDSAAESGAGTAFSRTYDYDVYGNRWVNAGSTNLFVQTPQQQSDFDATTNRLTTTFGASYDAAGNQTGYDNSGNLLDWTAAYDGENRQRYFCDQTAAACGSSNKTAEYRYDGEGRRVQKVTSSVTETYVYDAFGRLAAEYSTDASTSGGTFYRTTDHLGSTRLVTRQDQSDAACFDFAPFGEEIPDTIGSRSSNACFAASFDGRHRFTGQERDEESDLDYFLARYYSGPLGRFLSVDPLLNSGRPDYPQTWNRYGYVSGNPLRFIDSLGLYQFAVTCANGDDACKEQQQKFRDALAGVRASADALEEKSKERKKLERALRRIGEEEGKGALIAFGSDLKDGALAVTNPFTKTITFDLAKIDATTTQWTASSQRYADAFLASVVAHEGGHLPGRFGILNPFSIGTQRQAFYTESVFYQGRGITDLANQLWNESWRLVDRKKLEERRSAAIESILNQGKR